MLDNHPHSMSFTHTLHTSEQSSEHGHIHADWTVISELIMVQMYIRSSIIAGIFPAYDTP